VRNLKAVFRLPPTEKQSVVAVGSETDIRPILDNAEAVKFVGRLADLTTGLSRGSDTSREPTGLCRY